MNQDIWSSIIAYGMVALLVVVAFAVVASSLRDNSPGGSHELPKRSFMFNTVVGDKVYERKWLYAPNVVEFDPLNTEHQTALMMMHMHGRQHPTLRFKFDAAKHDSAYHYMMAAIVEAYVPKAIKDAALSQAFALSKTAVVVGYNGKIIRPALVTPKRRVRTRAVALPTVVEMVSAEDQIRQFEAENPTTVEDVSFLASIGLAAQKMKRKGVEQFGEWMRPSS